MGGSSAAPAGHPFELYLALNDIEHRRTKAPCPQTNGFVERFQRTAPDACFRQVFRETFYESVAALQADLDTWLGTTTASAGATAAAPWAAGRLIRSTSTSRLLDMKVKNTEYGADAAVCDACPLKEQCTPSNQGRSVHRHFDEAYLDRVRAYHKTAAYQKAIRKRQMWVEPLFAEAKEWHGLYRFRLRRLWRVNIEALLIGAGQNLKRLLSKRGWGRRPLPNGAMMTTKIGQRVGIWIFALLGFVLLGFPTRFATPYQLSG